MRVADWNEDHMHEYAHTQDPMLLTPIPARPKNLLYLAGAGVVIVAIVAALAFLMPGDRVEPKRVGENAVVFLLREQGENIDRITAVELVWLKENQYTHVTYTTKGGETLQRLYYGSHTQGEYFDPTAQDLGEKQVHYDNWQAAKQANTVHQFTPEELEALLHRG